MSMDSEWGERRRRTAELVLALLDGTVTTDEYWRRLDLETGCGDDELDELLDLVEHEPARSRLLGLGAREHVEYVAQVRALAERLSRRAGSEQNHPRHNQP
jgi:hypothetical protein